MALLVDHAAVVEPAFEGVGSSPRVLTLPCRDRPVLLSWEDLTAPTGPETLMGEGIGDGAVMGALFFFLAPLA